MHCSRKNTLIALVFAYGAIVAIACIYRFSQPLTSHALTQFDIFDWIGQSRNIQLTGIMPAHNIWFFPAFNALLSTLGHVDLFSVYLFGGAVVTTLALLPLAGIVWLLTKDHRATLITLFLYAVMQKILARSVMYLPEAMTYLFGLTLLYLYVLLFRNRRWVVLIPIWLVTVGFIFLHQSGLNFLAFSAIVTVTYVLFFSGLTVKWRYVLGSIAIALLSFLTIVIKPVRIGLTFFFSQGNGADKLAFQGDVISFRQIISAYEPLYVILFTLGVVTVVIHFFSKNPRWLKVSLGVLFLVMFFYFTFLYILPNLNIYRLTPWRFYTWFSLFTLPIVGYGISAVCQKVRLSGSIQAFAVAIIIIVSLNTSLVPDNMYTANAQTLQDMKNLPLPAQSLVITTNANYLQTRYALLEHEVSLLQLATEFFKASSPKAAHDYVKHFTIPGKETYILISKYQLRQRPTSIDYWRNSAMYDMDVTLFQQPFFETINETPEVLLLRVKL